MQFVFSTSQTKRYRFPTHINDLVVDRADSQTSEVFIVVLEPMEAPPLHKHDDTEQIFYILEGEGILSIGGEGQKYPVHQTDVVRILPGTFHSIQCTSEKAMRYLAIDCFVGGRKENEPSWDAHVEVICRQQGWNYDQLKEK